MSIGIGLFGGAFNPPHRGHVLLAKTLKAKLHLHAVYFIPNACPPHKNRPVTSFNDRAAMLELALQGQSGFKVARYEADPKVRHYTFDTVRRLRRRYGPHARLYFMMGLDSLLALNSWFRGFELTSYVNLAVISRPGFFTSRMDPEVRAFYLKTRGSCISQHDLMQPYGKCFLIHAREFDVSSTKLRQAFAQLYAGRDRADAMDKLSAMLNPKVIEYAAARRFYAAEHMQTA